MQVPYFHVLRTLITTILYCIWSIHFIGLFCNFQCLRNPSVLILEIVCRDFWGLWRKLCDSYDLKGENSGTDKSGVFQACRCEPYNHNTLMQIIEKGEGRTDCTKKNCGIISGLPPVDLIFKNKPLKWQYSIAFFIVCMNVNIWYQHFDNSIKMPHHSLPNTC